MRYLLSNQYLIAFIFVCLGCSFLIIAPLTTDDGWNIHIFDNYIKSGELILSGFDIPVNFSRIPYIFQSYLTKEFGFVYSQFAYGALFGMIGLFSVLKISFQHYFGSQRFLYLSLYILFFYSTFYIARTRPEAVYVNLLYLIFLLYSNKLGQKLVYFNVLFLSFLISFSIAAHPNGFFAIVMSCIYLYERRKSSFDISKIFVGIVSLFGFMYIFVLYKISFNDFFQSVSYLRNHETYKLPFYKEYVRYIYFANNNKVLSIFFLSLLVFIIKYRAYVKTLFLGFFQESSHLRFSFKCFVAALVFLTINPAKWDTYLVLIFPFLIDFIVSFYSFFDRLKKFVFFALVYGCIVTSWINSAWVNESSIYGKIFYPKRYELLMDRCNIISDSKEQLFVQNGIYPLFRSKDNCAVFWQITDKPNINIPEFSNKNLKNSLEHNKPLTIITEQSGLDTILSVSVVDSLIFNRRCWLVYSN